MWEYYNQKCSLSQAFDIIFNNKGVRELNKSAIHFSKDELLVGLKLVNEVKEKIKKDKVICIPTFRGIELLDDTPNRYYWT